MADSIMDSSLDDEQLEILNGFCQQEDVRGAFMKAMARKEPEERELETEKNLKGLDKDKEERIKEQLNAMCLKTE